MIVQVNGFSINDPTSLNSVYLDEPITGLGLAPLRTSSGNYSGRDGGYTGAQFYGMRLISLPGYVWASTAAAFETARMALEAAVSSLSVTLSITTNGGSQYVVNCKLDSLDLPIQRTSTKTSFLLTLTAPDPIIYDNSAGGLNTVSIAPVGGGGVTWPIAWTPVVWAPGTLPQTVTNTGNVPIYPVITLTGPATNPTIANLTTGQFFTIQGLTTSTGDVITIDMLNRTVLLNGGPIYTYVTLTSNWIALQPGGNTIKFTTTNSSDTVTGTISWRSGYRGI